MSTRKYILKGNKLIKYKIIAQIKINKKNVPTIKVLNQSEYILKDNESKDIAQIKIDKKKIDEIKVLNQSEYMLENKLIKKRETIATIQDRSNEEPIVTINKDFSDFSVDKIKRIYKLKKNKFSESEIKTILKTSQELKNDDSIFDIFSPSEILKINTLKEESKGYNEKFRNNFFLGLLIQYNRFKDVNLILNVHLISKKFFNVNINDWVFIRGVEGMARCSLLSALLKILLDNHDLNIKDIQTEKQKEEKQKQKEKYISPYFNHIKNISEHILEYIDDYIHPILLLCKTILNFQELELSNPNLDSNYDYKYYELIEKIKEKGSNEIEKQIIEEIKKKEKEKEELIKIMKGKGLNEMEKKIIKEIEERN